MERDEEGGAVVDKVTIVMGLKTCEGARCSFDEIRYFAPERPLPIATSADFVLPDLEDFQVQEKIVPIIRLCEVGRPDVLVALTEEVENLLGVPVRALVRRTKEAEFQAERGFHVERKYRTLTDVVRRMGVWHRLKFLFGLYDPVSDAEEEL